MIVRQKKILIFSLLILSMISSLSFASTKEWKEVKFKDEVVIIRDAGNSIKNGQLFARKDETTFILIGDDLGRTGEIAAADIQRYLSLATGCRINVVKESSINSKKNGFMIFLATTKSSKLLNWAGLDYPADLDEQECLIRPVNEFPDGTQGVVLIGGSNRGLLNGVYTLLEKSANVWWEPVRVLNPKYPLYSSINETILSQSNELRWEGTALRWKPVIRERIIYLHSDRITKRSVDWASRNRLSHFVIATPHELPMSEEKEKTIKSIVNYAQERGLKVLFMNMTHRLPVDSPVLPASSDEAVSVSTKLYLDQFKRFGLDGMTWHAASEGIHVNMDEEYKKKARIEWEAKYFNSYYNAIREVNKDAILVMLMGWVYMNPAEKLAKLFPEDIVAWIVPNTPIIDAAVTDIDSYDKHFENIWYWLYVMVSRDGLFPMVKTDYLEKYFREAITRGHSLAPQGVLYNNNENAMYYAQTAREGLIPNKTFLESFGERYYGDSRMGEVLIKYQEALKFHRNWFNNIHTVDINYTLTFEESDYLKEVYRISIDAAKNARTPLIKNRLKVLTITTLRCLIRRSPSPEGYGKDWNSNLQQLYEKNREEFTGMINEIKSVFPDHYFDKEKDFFWSELLEMESILSLPVFADEITNHENMSLPYQVRIDFFQKGNLFKNSSFEEWSGNHPVFWEAKEINKGEGITGNAVLFDKKDNSWSELVSEFIPVIPGNYFLKAKIKMENVVPPTGQKVGDILKVQLIHYDENKNVIERKDGYRYEPFDWSDKNMPFRFFDSIKEFKWSGVRFATDFYPLETGDIPDNTKFVQFIFKYKGPGKIWIDDISYSYTKWNFTPLERMKKYFDKDLSDLGEIIPTPKIVDYSDEYLTTDSKVQFIIPKENNKEIKNGISQLKLNKRENDDFESIIHTKNEIDSDIIVSVGDNELNRELLSNKIIEIDLIKNQQDGYIIKFLNYDNKSVVVIYGLNSVGNYYGLVSFNQLIRIESINQGKNEISIRKVDVTDWPDFKLRMISGYNTLQADDAQKIKATFEWMSSFKLNWFVLNYPSTSLQWWNPPLYYENMQKILKKEKEKFGEVIHFGNIINPYYNNSSFTQFLNETETAFRISDKEKVESLNKIIDIGLGNGGELVMVAVDDFVPHIAHQWGKKIFDKKDLQKFGSAGKAHAYLANYTYNLAKQKNSDVIFLFCPMNYNNYFVEIADLNSGINYFKDLGENVDENIGIIWTGSTVRSLDNDYAQIKRFSTYLQGRFPMLWDNTPYARARAAGYSWGHSPYKATLCNLFEAYEVNFPPDFHKYTFRSGVYINAGTGERYRAKDITVADFLWNQNTYDPDLSLWKALLTLYGKEDAIAILTFNDAYWKAQQVLNKYLKLKYQSERKILKEYNWMNTADVTESEKEKYDKECQDLFKQNFTINMKNQILTEYPEKREKMLKEFYQIEANRKLLNELKDYIFNQEKIFLEIKEYKVN